MKKLLFISGTLLFLSMPLLAQAPLTWRECVNIAAKNNPSFSSSRYALESSRASYKQSYNGLMPQVSLSHSYSDTSAPATGGPVSWQTSGEASMYIYNKSQISSIQSSSAQMYQSEASFMNASSTLRLNLMKAFYNLYFAQKNIEVSKNIVEMRDTESQLVTLRYNSGTEYKGNMQRAKAQLLQAQADLAQSIRDLRTAQRELAGQLGLDDFSVIGVTVTFTVAEPPALPQNEQALIEKRPDIIFQQAVIKSAEASLSQSKSSLLPTLSANYSLSSSGPDEPSSFGSPDSRVGLSLVYPLFGGGPTSTYYAVKAARNTLEKARQDLRSAKEQAIVTLESAWSNYAGAVDQAKVQEALLVSARTRNDEADIRYSSGLLTYDNWEIIASDRINQERQAISAQLNAINALASWENALGKLLEE